jgi:EAL domain-containing protein (putative c-di-GMP-specific phosphodiesterase class I)
VARVDQDAEGRAVVYAIVSLATALGVRLTGEGIETASQLATLIELDCKHGQGFLLSARPGGPQRGEYSQGWVRSKNSGSPTLSAAISSIWAFSSGGGSLRSPSRAAASEVK